MLLLLLLLLLPWLLLLQPLPLAHHSSYPADAVAVARCGAGSSKRVVRGVLALLVQAHEGHVRNTGNHGCTHIAFVQ